MSLVASNGAVWEYMMLRRRPLPLPGTTVPVVHNSADEEEPRDSASTLKIHGKRQQTTFALRFPTYTSKLSVCVTVSVAGLLYLAFLWCEMAQLLKAVTLLPAVVCSVLAVVCPGSQRILPSTIVATTLGAQLPQYIAAALASAALLWFGITTARDAIQIKRFKRTVAPPPTQVVISVLVLAGVMLTENFMIWVVSATFFPGQNPKTEPPPLQDNGQRLFQSLMQGFTKHQVVQLRRVWNVQWGLVSALGASFLVLDRYHPTRQLYAVGTRAIYTLSASRFVRTVSFLLTVVPSQVSGCFAQRFPSPPPTDVWEWIAVGFLPAAHGGCNDLIISGHATVTSTLACVAVSAHPSKVFGGCLVCLLLLDYSVEIYEGFHYSVDMWLGLVIVSLFWKVFSFWEDLPETKPANAPTSDATDFPQPEASLSNRDLAVYFASSTVSYLQVVVFPRSIVNGWIVVFVLSVAVCFVFMLRAKTSAEASTFQYYAQHILLCTLHMAFGVYL